MKALTINNFKGIKGPLNISFTKDGIPKNVLIYSENGGGKTSIAEALRYTILSREVENEVISPSKTGDDRKQAVKDLYRGLRNDSTKDTIDITIDDNQTVDLTKGTHLFDNKIAILNRKDLTPTSKLNIRELVKQSNFRIGVAFETLLQDDNVNLVISEVNKILEEDFKEEIRLTRLEQTGLMVGVTGILDSGHVGENLDTKLNEARFNLVKLLIFLTFLQFSNSTKGEVLVVLDDVMSSLDLVNRVVLARYIIHLGQHHQLLVLTHNVGFYNLLIHTTNIQKLENEWLANTLYSFDARHEIYSLNQIVPLEQWVKDREPILPENEGVINELRKRLEILLIEFNKIITLGIQEETKEILGSLASIDKNRYCCLQGERITRERDLLAEIRSIIDKAPDEQIKKKAQDCFSKYESTNVMPTVSKAISYLHSYQKLLLHPGSHCHEGEQPFASVKEIKFTIELMKKLEKIVKRPSSGYPYFL